MGEAERFSERFTARPEGLPVSPASSPPSPSRALRACPALARLPRQAAGAPARAGALWLGHLPAASSWAQLPTALALRPVRVPRGLHPSRASTLLPEASTPS